jgi:hypothetical protein
MNLVIQKYQVRTLLLPMQNGCRIVLSWRSWTQMDANDNSGDDGMQLFANKLAHVNECDGFARFAVRA